ncbi:MAG: glycosyltransferase family 2 protein [Flavobacteriales bacterium]
MTKVSITIPCRNEEKYIAKCLDSIVSANYPADLLRVNVVDGMSDDQTRAIVASYSAKYPFIHLIENTARVTPIALNLGIKSGEADVYFILGAHAEIYPDFILNSVNAFKVDEAIGCAGGIIEQVNEDEVSEVIAIAMSSSFGVGNAYFRTGGKEGFVDTVAFGAYKNEVFDKVGYFDEDLVRNQDDEFNYRVIKGGFKIYLTQSIRSKYYVRGSYEKLYKQYFQYGYWKVFVNQKHGAVTSIRQLIPPLFVAGLIGGMFLSLFIPYFYFLYNTALLAYLFAAFAFAWKAANGKMEMVLKVMFTFLILHFSYGLGYLKGVLNFVVLKKKPEKKHEALSR